MGNSEFDHYVEVPSKKGVIGQILTHGVVLVDAVSGDKCGKLFVRSVSDVSSSGSRPVELRVVATEGPAIVPCRTKGAYSQFVQPIPPGQNYVPPGSYHASLTFGETSAEAFGKLYAVVHGKPAQKSLPIVSFCSETGADEMLVENHVKLFVPEQARSELTEEELQECRNKFCDYVDALPFVHDVYPNDLPNDPVKIVCNLNKADDKITCYDDFLQDMNRQWQKIIDDVRTTKAKVREAVQKADAAALAEKEHAEAALFCAEAMRSAVQRIKRMAEAASDLSGKSVRVHTLFRDGIQFKTDFLVPDNILHFRTGSGQLNIKVGAIDKPFNPAHKFYFKDFEHERPDFLQKRLQTKFTTAELLDINRRVTDVLTEENIRSEVRRAANLSELSVG